MFFILSSKFIISVVEVDEVVDHLPNRLVLASEDYRQQQHVDDLDGLVPDGQVPAVEVTVDD